jgi:DNA-binding CsgD family transcriptional regulator
MDQVVLLRAGGFTNVEISEMLDISENSVSVFNYQAKQKKGRKINGTD